MTLEHLKNPGQPPVCGKPAHMIYDRRTGQLYYFPRKYSFELVFLDELIFSRFDIMSSER
jgi:hypothetical protein